MLRRRVERAAALLAVRDRSIADRLFEAGDLRIVMDGYITRTPASACTGVGTLGLDFTFEPLTPDVPAIERVIDALGGNGRVDDILTGHSTFDHAFDTAAWAMLTGAHHRQPVDMRPGLRRRMPALRAWTCGWIRIGGRSFVELGVPILRPKVYIPTTWDGLFNPFFAGMPFPFTNPSRSPTRRLRPSWPARASSSCCRVTTPVHGYAQAGRERHHPGAEPRRQAEARLFRRAGVLRPVRAPSEAC